jgi:predicted PurR-regulated permease PerM
MSSIIQIEQVRNRAFLKVLFLLGLLLATFWVLTYFPDLVLMLILSVLIAFVLKPIVKFFEFKIGMRRSLAVLVVFLLIGGILGGLGYIAVPIAMEGIKEMYAKFKDFPWDEKLLLFARDLSTTFSFLKPDDIAGEAHSMIKSLIEMLNGALQNVISYAVTFLIVPFITYFALAEGDAGFKNLIERVPNKYFEMTLNVFYKISIDLVGYLKGWLLDSLFVGIVSIIGYYIIGVDNAILIGIVAGVANLVPYLGPVAGAVPAFLLSLTQYGDFRMLGPIALVTVSVQLIDNMMIQPLCFAKSVDMHPITVIIVLLVGNTLMGVMGMLIAIPLFTILKVSATETYWGLRHYRITAT